jgi:hypothetical protein
MRPCLLVLILFTTGCGCGSEKSFRPADRSWSTGVVEVSPVRDGQERGITVRGKWPDASPDLWIRYELSLVQDGAPEVFLLGGHQPLEPFARYGVGVSDYSGGALGQLDRAKPYRAVFDYEIWQGLPDKGRLLTKQSAFSAPIQEK